MASASSLSVSVECVNACKLLKGEREGSGGRNYGCSVVSCAWRAPRVLTGFLASTAHPSPCYSCPSSGRRPRRSRFRCEALDIRGSFSNESSAISLFRRCCKSTLLHVPNKRWQRCCLSDACGEVSPESLWLDLKPSIAYLSTEELDMVHNALNVAFEAHEGQKRRSGEPFIIHPVEVARILGEFELDWESIAAGLLHDTVEDTNVTFERIEEDFGPDVRHIVEGETKVSKLGKLKCKVERDLVQDVKAEDLRQMFLAMTEEVRVIIVKLADRLHNMRTLSHMPAHKQLTIATETLKVFAPLAKLLGMYKIKSELENLSFMHAHPEKFREVKRKVADLYTDQEKEITEANKILRKKIEEDQFLHLLIMNAEVRSMCKEPYSIYKTVLKSEGSISEVNQIAQLVIVIKPKPPFVGIWPLCSSQQICYHVLGLVHGLWTPVPRSMKDYIATPKQNGYQSLHTTVFPFLNESSFQLEVQIRTEEMDLIAERGIAAHYSGRGKSVCLNNADIALKIGWLNSIREWQEQFVGNMSSREFVETVTKDLLLGSRIFVFSPKGEIKNLPKGATVIDYAYMIDTEIGNKMIAGKVNDNPVSPIHVLANAEVVEIITYDAVPSKTAYERHQQWLQHAKTLSARHKITKFLEEQASLCAGEIKAELVNDFVANSGEENRKILPRDKLRMQDLDESSRGSHSEAFFCIENGRALVPMVNGKPSKHLRNASLSANGALSQKIGVSQVMQAHIPSYKEVLPALESWQASKVAGWQTREGHSIQWFSVVCIDCSGMMGKVTTALEAMDIRKYSCEAEIDKGWGMAVMLFHVEGELDALVRSCSNVDLIPGILGWSTGCSIENQRVHEC